MPVTSKLWPGAEIEGDVAAVVDVGALEPRVRRSMAPRTESATAPATAAMGVTKTGKNAMRPARVVHRAAPPRPEQAESAPVAGRLERSWAARGQLGSTASVWNRCQAWSR